jgi:ribonuclease HI
MSNNEQEYRETTQEEYEAAVEQRAGEEQGMCLWTDGSCIPNPGFGGWGLHGYLYSVAVPKKGTGNPDHVLTKDGYVLKADAQAANMQAITPLHYVDGFGSFENVVTNNIAELSAAYYGLLHAAEYNVKSVSIYTDSEYVRKGMDSWVHAWKKHGWKRSDGSPITNVDDWRRLSDQRDALEQKGIKVTIDWVRAHSDILGNVKADRLAMIGTVHSIAKKVQNHLTTSVAEGYWKYDTEAHPFISHPCLYFNTRKSHLVPGEYYLGYHGKEDDQFGNRMSDGAFAVVRLSTPDPILEMLIEHQGEMADESDNLMKMFMGNIMKADVHKELSQFGGLATYRVNPYSLNLVGMDDEPLTKEFKPAKLAYRAVENIGALADKLNQFQAQDPVLTVTDLTPILYETVVKTGKKESTSSTVLKAEYKVGFAALEVMAKYQKADSATGELGEAFLKLTLGIDLLDRNGLKRLETLNPRVSLITWVESELAFRHATVIEVDGAIGIWAGMYSNIRCLTPVAATA